MSHRKSQNRVASLETFDLLIDRTGTPRRTRSAVFNTHLLERNAPFRGSSRAVFARSNIGKGKVSGRVSRVDAKGTRIAQGEPRRSPSGASTGLPQHVFLSSGERSFTWDPVYPVLPECTVNEASFARGVITRRVFLQV